jgi:hypothetical protein
MKHIFIIAAALLACTTLSAQTNVGPSINYYGVDFSNTKVFAATETGLQFKDAFSRINSLVIAEWPKYNLGKFLSKNIAIRDISPTTRFNNAIDPSMTISTSSNYSVSNDMIAEMIGRYELPEKEGTGLVIVGELLDKSTYMGSFVVVYFDIASREVLYSREIIGKARGFGLRNYWAGALYDALRRY